MSFLSYAVDFYSWCFLVGETPLVYAVRGDTVDTVQYLLDHGANPDKPDANGSTPLHLAAAGGLSLCILFSFLRVRDTVLKLFIYLFRVM